VFGTVKKKCHFDLDQVFGTARKKCHFNLDRVFGAARKKCHFDRSRTAFSSCGVEKPPHFGMLAGSIPSREMSGCPDKMRGFLASLGMTLVGAHVLSWPVHRSTNKIIDQALGAEEHLLKETVRGHNQSSIEVFFFGQFRKKLSFRPERSEVEESAVLPVPLASVDKRVSPLRLSR
jgi:hypothetical protein